MPKPGAASQEGHRSTKGGGRASALALLAALALCACTTAEPAANGPCLPQFPLAEGWLGGDIASSSPLGDGQTLWLFGDTFIAPWPWSGRAHSAFVHNTVAVARCRAGISTIDYVWRGRRQAPQPFFPGRAETWSWPLAAMPLGAYRQLVVLARAAPSVDAPPFGFRLMGADLAFLDTREGDPRRWTMQVVPLSEEPDTILGSALAQDGRHVLLFATLPALDKNPAALALARLPLPLSGDGVLPALEWLGRDGRWHARLARAQRAELFAPAPSELSVSARPGAGDWRAVYLDPALGGRHLLERRAPRPEGPWSAPVVVGTLPARERNDASLICYAGKEHPPFETQGARIATAICQTADEMRLLADRTLYVPLTVRFDGR